MQTLARWLARAGWQVVSLSTNASEAPHHAQGLSNDWIAQAAQAPAAAVQPLNGLRGWCLQAGGVRWLWLPTRLQQRWEADAGPAYNSLLQQQLGRFKPELVLTFGDDPGDRRRRQDCRRAGARVVFALHNRAYLGRRVPHVDAALCPSGHLAALYRADGWPGLQVLPAPVEAADLWPGAAVPDAASLQVRAADQALCLVYANPEPAKGSMLVARLVAELARRGADVPVLVAGGRGHMPSFAAAVQACGVDPQRLSGLMLAPQGLPPGELLRLARVVLMPSVVEEAAGRMAIEAQCVGAVPVVSDRGALPETVGPGGLVLPLPERLLQAPARLPEADEVAPWTDAVQRLFDDAGHWRQLSAAAWRRSQAYTAAQGVPALHAAALAWRARSTAAQPPGSR